MAERLGASGVDDDSEKDFSVFSRGISVLVSEIASVSRACNVRFTGVERALHERGARVARAWIARCTSVKRWRCA